MVICAGKNRRQKSEQWDEVRFLALVAQEIRVVILWEKDDEFVVVVYGQWFMGRAEGGSADLGYLIWRQRQYQQHLGRRKHYTGA